MLSEMLNKQRLYNVIVRIITMSNYTTWLSESA